jgi:hypothetical protein
MTPSAHKTAQHGAGLRHTTNSPPTGKDGHWIEVLSMP